MPRPTSSLNHGTINNPMGLRAVTMVTITTTPFHHLVGSLRRPALAALPVVPLHLFRIPMDLIVEDNPKVPLDINSLLSMVPNHMDLHLEDTMIIEVVILIEDTMEDVRRILNRCIVHRIDLD